MNNIKSILIIDDQSSMRKNISDLLSPLGYQILEAGNGDSGMMMFREKKPHLIILDINLPGKNGLDVLKEIKQISDDTPVIIFTAFGTSERAIEAMKLGAFDYLEKPFELDEFILTIERASEYQKLITEVIRLRSIVKDAMSQPAEGSIIGRNQKMQEIFKLIGRIAPSDATVLIQGESGTGKELIADAIQRHSLLSDKSYVKINCGALSESILESEIFGHEKGSFTGAESRRKGLFEIADGGTVYLDEINSMPQSLQVRLLRILQKQSFFRVGGVTPVNVNVRIIASSNKDIEKEMKDGNFRKDLYYRLCVVKINIPPLRERKDDIGPLVEHFLRKYSPSRKMIIPPESMNELCSYSWPGNIRELENTIYSSLVTATNDILNIRILPLRSETRQDEFSFLSLVKAHNSFRGALNYVEKKIIEDALKINNNNQTRTADFLKINRRLLYTKMKEYRIITDDLSKDQEHGVSSDNP
ncbi:MAG: sigma-54-dependent Fis family transcriptional regulator [Bacteroidales bacterium]|nr:sigma-54-dependent Fis family transcriptional regulator [Bacteroidales bacterium]